MKYASFTSLIIASFILTSCNGDKFNVKDREVSGDVSVILNNLNPLSSAYANDEAICSPSAGVNNRKVKIYIVNKAGEETKICETHLGDNKKYKFNLKENLIPKGSFLKVKAELAGGAIREAVSQLDGLSVLKLDPSSTLAAPVLENMIKKDVVLNSQEMRKKMEDFVAASLGVPVASLSAAKIASLKMMMKSSAEAIEENVMSQKSGALAAAHLPDLKNFLLNVYNTNYKLNSDGSIRSGNDRLTYK
jgi:hypothetical protein